MDMTELNELESEVQKSRKQKKLLLLLALLLLIVGERPPAGEYNARALFRALLPETMEEIGTTGATMLILVE